MYRNVEIFGICFPILNSNNSDQCLVYLVFWNVEWSYMGFKGLFCYSFARFILLPVERLRIAKLSQRHVGKCTRCCG